MRDKSEVQFRQQFPIPQFVGIGMLAWALVPSNPYGYYIVLRIVICGISAFVAMKAQEINKMLGAWTFGLVAVVYNPLIRVPLSRPVWVGVNVATIALFLVSIWWIREPNHRNRGKDSSEIGQA